MSRLLGPPSETIKSVSDRASALAGEKTAGAGTIAPPANPDTDFRKSRRFMGGSNARGDAALAVGSARFVPNLNGTLASPYIVDNTSKYSLLCLILADERLVEI